MIHFSFLAGLFHVDVIIFSEATSMKMTQVADAQLSSGDFVSIAGQNQINIQRQTRNRLQRQKKKRTKKLYPLYGLDGATVSRDMRFAKDNNSERLFVASEFLTDKQITSYFSRLSSKIKKGQIVDLGIVADMNNEDEDDLAAEDEDAIKFIINECQLEHPIVFDSFDLCKLSKTNNLTKLSVSLLRTMYEFFHLDCSHITVHRKAPYI